MSPTRLLTTLALLSVLLALAPAAPAAQNDATPTAGGESATPTAVPITQPDSDPDRPLDARLGGTRESFEASYGKPSAELLATIFPYGVEYDTDDFGIVDAFFHKDLVLFVRIQADRVNGQGSGIERWTIDQAKEIARVFMPVDVVLDDDFAATSDNLAVGGGHSSALAPIFGRATYQQYGAFGERGDVHYIFSLDDTDRVISIEVRIGSSAVALTGLTAEEQTYVDAVNRRIRAINASIQRVGALYAKPEGTDAWRSAVQAEVVYWRLSHTAVRRITPPPDLAAVHRSYLDGFTLYASAADDLEASLRSDDPSRVERAAAKLRAGVARISIGTAEITKRRAARQG